MTTKAPSNETPRAPRAGTKKASLVRLLLHKTGATIEEITSSTNWQPHTVRAAFTDLKKRGYTVEREADEGGSRYFIRTSAA